MNEVEINQKLDEICEGIASAPVLNSLHACRPGHPLGRGNTPAQNFSDAAFVCAGRRDVSMANLKWLREMSEQ